MYLWAANRTKTAKSKAFTYYWNHAEPGPDEKRYGAFHTSEVPCVFNTLDKSSRPWPAKDHKIAETLGAHWANFAANRDQWEGLGLVALLRSCRHHGTGKQFGPIPIADQQKVELFTQYFTRQQHALRNKAGGSGLPPRRSPFGRRKIRIIRPLRTFLAASM
jgi:para-nitrobenzyl esterase